MASRGRSRLSALVLGSVTNNVLTHSKNAGVGVSMNARMSLWIKTQTLKPLRLHVRFAPEGAQPLPLV
jgi:hypothetical protein